MIRIVAVVAVIAAALLMLTRGSDTPDSAANSDILTRGSDAPASAASGERTSVNVVRACLVTPTCGSKGGKRKEYVHTCAAEDDGATDIRPMRGRACDAF